MAYTQHEGRHTGAYIVDDNIHLSRETVTYAKGAVLQPGTVLGIKKADGNYAPFNPTASDGTEVAKAICYDNYDASLNQVKGVASVRGSAVKASELLWPQNITEAQKTKAVASLSENSLILR